MTTSLTAPANVRSSNRLARFALLLDQVADPLGFEAGDTNLRRYVGNSPTNATDPSGLAEGDPPSVGDITDGDLPGLITFDPILRTIGEPQRTELLKQLQNTGSQQFKFAAQLVLLTSNFGKADYRKTWWLLGPGDQHFPGNVGGDYKTTYNCLGHVLSWYGTTKFNGKDVISSGRETWPDVPEVFTVGDLEAQLRKFDAIFATLGRRGFQRIDWKPNLSSLDAAINTKLPAFEKNVNYIIVLGNFRNKDGDDKPVTAISLKHVYTNFDCEHRWWISKGGNGGTFLHGIDGIMGDDEFRSGYGFTTAIYCEKAEK